MNKTKIEWTDYTKNPIKGKCRIACEYCYAIRHYNRFKWNPEIRFAPSVLKEIKNIKEPSKIFLCSTHEIFGGWIERSWQQAIFDTIWDNSNHTFQILTKLPENIPNIYMPPNLWLGVTIDKQKTIRRKDYLLKTDAGIKFISFEPLLEEINIDLDGIDWVIIGAETGNRKGKIKPKKEWIEELIGNARIEGIPIFLKNNLKWGGGEKIQEFPKT